jgi:hypothetical protein
VKLWEVAGSAMVLVRVLELVLVLAMVSLATEIRRS